MLGATRAYSGLFYSCLLCTVFLRVIARAVKKDTGGIINHFMRLMNDNFCSYVVWKHLFPVIFMAVFTSSVLILLHISHTSHYYLGCTKVSINVESFLLLLVCPSVVQFWVTFSFLDSPFFYFFAFSASGALFPLATSTVTAFILPSIISATLGNLLIATEKTKALFLFLFWLCSQAFIIPRELIPSRRNARTWALQKANINASAVCANCSDDIMKSVTAWQQ